MNEQNRSDEAAQADTADRLIGRGCAVGLLIAVLLIAGGVL